MGVQGLGGFLESALGLGVFLLAGGCPTGDRSERCEGCGVDLAVVEVKPLVDLGHFEGVGAVEGVLFPGEVSQDGVGLVDRAFGGLQ